MIDIKNSVIFVLCLLIFAGIYGGMLIHALVGSPASVACFEVDGQRLLQKNNFWCPQIIRFVDLEEAVILFFVACQFWFPLFFC